MSHQLSCVIDFLNTQQFTQLRNQKTLLDLLSTINGSIVKQRENQETRASQPGSQNVSFNMPEIDQILKEMRIKTKLLQVNLGEQSYSLKHSLPDRKIVMWAYILDGYIKVSLTLSNCFQNVSTSF